MQKSNLIRKGRKGFTLVEVALAVAVGLIVIGGAIVGFNAVRENASNSSARQKVDAAVGIVENLAASRNQIYPTSGVTSAGAAGDSLFATTWKAQRPDWNANPWGGLNTDSDAAAGNGVTEFAAATFGHASQTTADAVVDPTTPSVTAPAAGATDGAGNLIYQTATAAGPWGRIADVETGVGAAATLKTVKGYYISLYDKGGNPFWYVKGGK